MTPHAVRCGDYAGSAIRMRNGRWSGFPNAEAAAEYARRFVRAQIEDLRGRSRHRRGIERHVLPLRRICLRRRASTMTAWVAHCIATPASRRGRGGLCRRRTEGPWVMKLRFAPSPTGLLHVGNARVALANWLLARQRGGTVLLRLDDTDTERVQGRIRRGDRGGPPLARPRLGRKLPPVRPPAALRRRRRAAEGQRPPLSLPRDRGGARASSASSGCTQGSPPLYDRAALKMTQEQLASAVANGKPPHWRFKLCSRTVEWQDGVLGRARVKLPSLSDPVLIRADGTPLYTFTSVVDDLDSGVTHVVRGEDHVTNTGIQLDIWEALGGRGHRASAALRPSAAADRCRWRAAVQAPRQRRPAPAAPRRGRAGGAGRLPRRARHLAGPGRRDAGATSSPASSSTPSPSSPGALRPAAAAGAEPQAPARRALRGGEGACRRARTRPSGSAVRGNLDLLREAKDWWEVVRGTIVPPPQPGEAGVPPRRPGRPAARALGRDHLAGLDRVR